MRNPKIIVATVLIVVMLTSTYAFGPFGPLAVQASRVAPEQSVQPQIPQACANELDLSTGTNGAIGADAVGTAEAAGRWLSTRGFVSPEGTAISIAPESPGWALSPYVQSGGGFPGRINYISNSTGDQAVGYYYYDIQFTTSTPGKFYISFTADNSAQLQLLEEPSATQLGQWKSTHFPTSFPPANTPAANDFKQWWPTASGTPTSVNIPTYTGQFDLRAIVFNNGLLLTNRTDTSKTGLAVYAYFCPTVSPTPYFPSNFNPKFSYTVKFLCNVGADASNAASLGLEQGFYQTNINVHNPSFLKTSEQIVKKFVLSVNESNSPPPAEQLVNAEPFPYVVRWAELQPDAAMTFNCGEIVSALSVSNGAAVGFVIIYSQDPINVWAEYTVANASGVLVALQVVQIQPAPYTP